jgi:hypothetical protein
MKQAKPCVRATLAGASRLTRDVALDQTLGELVKVFFGRVLVYGRVTYRSGHIADAKPGKSASSYSWMEGPMIKNNWSGHWHGRIQFLVKVQIHDKTHYYAAVRVIGKPALTDGPMGSTLFDSTKGFSPLTYYVRVQDIGGQECLCPCDERRGHRWIVYLDHNDQSVIEY